MRYLRGGNLSDALARGPLDLESTALLLDQICSALALAHGNGIVHRDIKPGNILLDEDGNAYLTDFGIAKDIRLNDGGATEEGGLVGSPDYIAPEQARNEPVTARSDIYSLGIVLFEALTGEHPFPNLTPVERLFKHLNDRIPNIAGFDPELTDAINRTIQRATAKNPDGRFTDVGALAVAFREAAGLSIGRVGRNEVELLTAREQEVLTLVVAGRSNREIAEKLVVEVATVKWYVHQIFRKLGVRSRVQAIVRARELLLGVEGTGGRVAPTTSRTGLAEPENPYRGLSPFHIADEHYFFGRERLVDRLLFRLAEPAEFSRFLAIVGPSGSGKSSLVKAGLIPALWRGGLPGSERWFVVEIMPGERPLDELEIALMRIAVQAPGNLMEQLQRDAHGLTRAAQLILPDDGSELMIVIDQFEELFTLVRDEGARRHFIDLLHAAVVDPRSRVRVVVTLRADFYDRPLQDLILGALLQSRLETVLPLSAEELERAIRQPAEVVGVKFEEGLVAAIAQEIHYQPGALPLLQYALTELFEQREGRTLTHAGYEEIGRSVGALAKRLEEVFAELTSPAQAFVQQMFLRLVTLGEGKQDTRRRTHRSELLAIGDDRDLADEVIDSYTANRLLTLDHDPTTRSPMVELAHEAILNEWIRLRGWLEESRGDIRLQRMLASAAEAWKEAEADPSFLLRGGRLAQFDSWSKVTGLALTQDERTYLQASLALRGVEESAEAERQVREAQLERRARRVMRWLVGVFAAAAIVSGGLALFALRQREASRVQAAILLSAQAETEREDGYFDRAVLLALEALENYPYTPQAEHALGRAVSENRALMLLTGHTNAATSVDWSPDGTQLASSSTDNTIQVWDSQTGGIEEVIHLPTGVSGNVFDWALTVMWSPDGQKLLTVSGDRFLLGSQDYDLMLWEAETGEQLRSVEIPNQTDPEQGRGTNSSAEHYAVSGLAAFGPKTARLATVGGDNRAIIWDATLENRLALLAGNQNDVTSVAWSPDETRLATGSEDGTASIWDGASARRLLVLSGHEGAVNQVAWSPDGSRLATAGKDGQVRFWNADTGEVDQILSPDGGIVWSVAWSPDGRYLATGTNDAVVRLWEIASGKELALLRGHENFVSDVAWSPDGNRLASAAADGSVRIWNGAPGPAVLTFPSGYVNELGWAPDGRRVAVTTGDPFGSEAGALSIWDVTAGRVVAEGFERGLNPAWFWQGPEISPDGRLLMARGSLPWPDVLPDQATVHVFDVASGAEVKSFTATDGGFVRASGWSPDGSKIAAGTGLGENGTLYVWDYQTGKELSAVTCGNWAAALDWSPDGDKIAVLCLDAGGAEIRSWIEVRDASSGATLMTLTDPDPLALNLSVSWSPNGGKLLTTGGDDQLGSTTNPVIVWDARTGERLLTINQHTGHVWWGDWSPDGGRIVTGSTDDTARIWDAGTGAEVLRFETPSNWAVYPRWSPDGNYLAIAAYSFDGPGTSSVWRVWQTTEELIAYARECCVFRQLTPAEREQFGLPPRP